mmetsp:Transcript_73905/g.203463  ORF Transcript_73905/g.203463 Transcript_73905/m.203463 type:complete len:250 (-) Transcript_73905:137-886(-)
MLVARRLSARGLFRPLRRADLHLAAARHVLDVRVDHIHNIGAGAHRLPEQHLLAVAEERLRLRPVEVAQRLHEEAHDGGAADEEEQHRLLLAAHPSADETTPRRRLARGERRARDAAASAPIRVGDLEGARGGVDDEGVHGDRDELDRHDEHRRQQPQARVGATDAAHHLGEEEEEELVRRRVPDRDAQQDGGRIEHQCDRVARRLLVDVRRHAQRADARERDRESDRGRVEQPRELDHERRAPDSRHA